MLRPAANNHTISSTRRLANHLFRDSQNAFTVERFHLMGVDAAFITSTYKGLEQLVVQRIILLLTLFHCSLGTLRRSRDFFRQLFVVKLPTQALRKQLRDFSAPGTIFSFHANKSDHTNYLQNFCVLTNCEKPALWSPFGDCRKKSAHRHFSATAGIVLLQEKRQKKHNPRQDRQHHKGIHVSESGGLRLDLLVNDRIGMRQGVRLPGSSCGHLLREVTGGVLKIEIALPDVVSQ